LLAGLAWLALAWIVMIIIIIIIIIHSDDRFLRREI
jgi:hypothetical protein